MMAALHCATAAGLSVAVSGAPRKVKFMTLPTATWPGHRFGATERGIGSVASMGRRMAAFLIDIVVCALVAFAFTWPDAPQNLSLIIWAATTILTVAVLSMTPGQWLLGIRVASIRGATFIGAWAIIRTALIFLVIPPLIVDDDGRGLHDKACRTIVLRFR